MRETILSNLEGLRLASTSMERDKFVSAIMEQFDVLYSELATLRERTRWIPVSDSSRFPTPDKDGKFILVGGKKRVGILQGRVDDGYAAISPIVDNDWSITHWMPLPEPPEVKE